MMNYRLKPIFFLIIMYSCFSLKAQVVDIWPNNKIPNFTSSEEKEVIPERKIQFIKQVQTPTLEIFLPSEQSSNNMGVLIMPGGGYAGVSYDWEGTDVAKWLNAKGFSAFVLKYRMPGAASVVTSYKAPIQDAQRAIRYIKANAKQFFIANENIGVMGFSAGGHLASTLGTHFNNQYYQAIDTIDSYSSRPSFMALIYPVISFDESITHKGSRKNLLGKHSSSKLIKQFSNELQVTKKTPPTFIVHSQDDKAVPVENSLAMYAALTQNNIVSEMHLYPSGGHGYGLGLSKEHAPDWSTVFELWSKKIKD